MTLHKAGVSILIVFLFHAEASRTRIGIERTASADTVEPAVTVREFPPVLMHIMPWFLVNKEHGWAGWHWQGHLAWENLLADGKVAAHYSPLIGPYTSSDRLVIRYQLGLMRAAGVEGVILDWYGTREAADYGLIRAASDALVEEASAAGMLFTVCYEDYSVGDDLSWGQEPTGAELMKSVRQHERDFNYVRDVYMSKPGFLRESERGRSGRPMWLVFGPRVMRDKAIWDSAVQRTFPDPLDPNRPVLITLYNGGPRIGEGQFSWFPPMRQNDDLQPQNETLWGLCDYLDRFYTKSAGSPHVGNIFPGYHDYYEQSVNDHDSYGRLPEYDGLTFSASVEQAFTHQPTFIQATTWNDYQEGTVFEPAERPHGSFYFLLKLQAVILGYQDMQALQYVYDTYLCQRKDFEDFKLNVFPHFSRKRAYSSFIKRSVVGRLLDRNVSTGDAIVRSRPVQATSSRNRYYLDTCKGLVTTTTTTTTRSTTTHKTTMTTTTLPEFLDFTSSYAPDSKVARLADSHEYYCCCKVNEMGTATACHLIDLDTPKKNFFFKRCGAYSTIWDDQKFHSWTHFTKEPELKDLRNAGKCIIPYYDVPEQLRQSVSNN